MKVLREYRYDIFRFFLLLSEKAVELSFSDVSEKVRTASPSLIHSWEPSVFQSSREVTLGHSHRKYSRLGFLSGGLGPPVGFGCCSLESQRRPLNTICLQEGINRVENQESV